MQVAAHKDSADLLLRALQRDGILHVTGTEEQSCASALDRKLDRVREAIEQLGPREKKKGGLFTSKLTMSREEFDAAAASDPNDRLETLALLNKELADISSRQKAIDAETARLAPWDELRHDPQELYALGAATVILGRFADSAEFERTRDLLRARAASWNRWGRSGRMGCGQWWSWCPRSWLRSVPSCPRADSSRPT